MLRRRTSENYRFLMYVRRAVAWPIRKGIGVGHQILTVYMLTGIEVAIEYMLGLTYSPQVQIPSTTSLEQRTAKRGASVLTSCKTSTKT